MGRQDVEAGHDPGAIREFTRALLRDLQALETMLAGDMIERDIRRFGAEQELFLVDKHWRPAPLALEVLDRLADPAFTTELARFNLEFNLDPKVLRDRCFSELEQELNDRVAQARDAAAGVGADVVLTGILPTLSKSDLTLDNLTPRPRYHALNDAMNRMRGGAWRLKITGTDDLNIEHDSVMLEACNTSAQIHLQVTAEEFAPFYNVAQLMTGPVLSAAVNSPLLFGRRLWSETRIALFQQSLDTRSSDVDMRELRPRVRFGERWLDESVVELFQEDIAHFRVLIAGEVEEDPLEVLASGGVPGLKALQLHNSTVYRWNRPCYGVGGGKPHLRIECRVLPSGPTIRDEVGNAAFWVGAVLGGVEEYGDVRSQMKFDLVRGNFLGAARRGLNAGFHWFDQEVVDAPRLILDTLLPLAREGLRSIEVDESDIERYLGVVRDRVDSRRTGASWMLRSAMEMNPDRKLVERLTALTAGTAARQRQGGPVHTWDLATLEDSGRPNFRTVEQYMNTSPLTVNEEELLDLAAFLMDRNSVRHVLVEDSEHRLVGIVSYRSLIRMIAQGRNPAAEPLPVRDVMYRDPITVSPETDSMQAIQLMRERQISCLPVVSRGKLVGIVTNGDFMPVAYELLREQLERE